MERKEAREIKLEDQIKNLEEKLQGEREGYIGTYQALSDMKIVNAKLQEALKQKEEKVTAIRRQIIELRRGTQQAKRLDQGKELGVLTPHEAHL